MNDQRQEPIADEEQRRLAIAEVWPLMLLMQAAIVSSFSFQNFGFNAWHRLERGQGWITLGLLAAALVARSCDDRVDQAPLDLIGTSDREPNEIIGPERF